MAQSICTHGFIPVRSKPAESAQLETQILFGESFEALEYTPGWYRIKCHFDGYEGWIDEKLLTKLEESEVESWIKGSGMVVNKPYVEVIREPDSSAMLISAGSRVVFNGEERNAVRIGNSEFFWQENLPEKKGDTNMKSGVSNLQKSINNIHGEFHSASYVNKFCTEEIETVAKGFLNSPYLWGGRSFYGIDCSGLVQVVYKIVGICLPRNASQQIEKGETVSFVEEAKTGDLAFFDDEEGRIIHVGICLGQGLILHASGCVRIDTLDHQGIYNKERRLYSHRLRAIKRVLNE